LAGFGFFGAIGFFANFFIPQSSHRLTYRASLWKTKLHHYQSIFLVDTALIEN